MRVSAEYGVGRSMAHRLRRLGVAGAPQQAVRPPGFRAKNFLHVHKVSDCVRFSHTSQYAMGDVAFSSAERDRHLGIRPVSQLNTWPVVSPRPSRDAAHHSGLGQLARPFLWGTFTSYSLPACLAHSGMGHELTSRMH
jgi:hypothetical protein